MTKSQHNRRNFLSSIAILSAGTALGSAIQPFQSTTKEEELDKKWASYWKKAGGQIFSTNLDLKQDEWKIDTKGHLYDLGEMIYFSKENIFAQATWIYWGNDQASPADMIITLFENKDGFKKITRLNRYELDALYKLSNEFTNDALLLLHHNNMKTVDDNRTCFVQNKTTIQKKFNTQQVSYYKEQALVFHKKFIYNS
jgi:hypothetical protein